ncbi:hypothetical protein TEA_004958 [Camellia sinensis var. sinensis]|uniref:Uncharacterized protein n=1 Tax=Camellia sinensis var. sinensis TaxID=542762 RepID=A0A4S4ELR5_CAMSN|nr:hypothetical protein TEA_004958 [Camellia sinensis var. sinensis]
MPLLLILEFFTLLFMFFFLSLLSLFFILSRDLLSLLFFEPLLLELNQDIESAVNTVILKYGKLDIMINNAVTGDEAKTSILAMKSLSSIETLAAWAVWDLRELTPLTMNFFKIDESDASSVYSNLKEVAPCSEDVARAALYLGSDESKYMSGHNLALDRGFTVINLAFGLFAKPK